MRRGGLLLLLLSSLLLQDGAVARGTELERLTVGYTAIASPQAPAWVAHDLGSFRQHGLDVQLRYIESGRLGVAALVARELPVLVLAATAAIQAALGGADVVLIAGLTNILAYRVVTVPEITRPEELRGKKLGILRPGDITESAFRRVLRHYGIPPTEVSFLQIGGQPTRLQAVKAGVVHATVANPPLVGQRHLGLRDLLDTSTLNIDYQMTSVATTRTFIRERPETLLKFMRGLVHGIALYKRQKAESLAVISRYMRITDREALEEAYQAFAVRALPRKPYPTLKGIQAILDDLGGSNPRAREVRPEAFVDERFMRELDQSGFFDQLPR